MECDGCKELQEIKALLQKIDLSQYVKKSEFVDEVEKNKDAIVKSIIESEAWPEIVVDVDLQNNIEIVRE